MSGLFYDGKRSANLVVLQMLIGQGILIVEDQHQVIVSLLQEELCLGQGRNKLPQHFYQQK
jgi:hypothetical protein